MSVDVKVEAGRAGARIGTVIKDKWRLDQLLGVGGMACVYAATHRNKKRAAVKMLHREYSTDLAIRQRFLREGYLANSVGHRGVVTVDDDDVAEDGAVFIVMELLDGETLDQRWRRKQHRLPLEEVLAVADQVLDALAAAHDKGVVHRDLKPENLFLTRDGVVKLLDFGIGRLRELHGTPSATLAGAAMGTPAFMAPEQARGRWELVDGQTDLWALGATMFALLGGHYVHEGRTVNEMLALAARRPARSIKTLRPDLPAAVVALIDRALAFAKPQRFPDARAMQAHVRLVYAGLSAGEGAHGGPLSLPGPAPVPTPPSAAATTMPRERSTARRPSVPAWLAPLWATWAAAGPRRWLLAAAAVTPALLLALLAVLVQDSDSPALPAPAAPSHAAPPALAVVTSAPPPAADEAPSAVPPVSVEELPRERRRKSRHGSRKP